MKSPATVIERALTDSAAGTLPQETEAEGANATQVGRPREGAHLAQALDEHEHMTQGRHRKQSHIPL
jgi:hypothetical protein